ncbi:MAG TPA: enolase C-terminal domain-like protein [Solirubrobacteraceae bacterium]|nr:enolase C-terminal domain-like protein [Solirubrobacteraceae bacterium]
MFRESMSGSARLRLSVRSRTVRLKSPLQTAYGAVCERELLTVTLTDADGLAGWGEAAPLRAYDGVSAARVKDALQRYAPALADAQERSGAQVVEACRVIEDLPQALAAVDMALWDRAGRRAGRRVAELLVDDPADEVMVNATIGAIDRQGAAEQAAKAAADGFECIKVKVGVGDDAGRVAAVRAAAGARPALRLDANGAWDVQEAVRAIEALTPAGLELVEEPTHGLRAVREVRERVSARIAIDETAAEPGALGAGVADAVCLKVGRCGGISGLIAAAALVRSSGAEVYLASALDGPLGVAAALHAAAALASRGPVPACGLATLGMFEGIDEELPVARGRIALPSAPGLGVGPL